jgi:hypothetical protein
MDYRYSLLLNILYFNQSNSFTLHFKPLDFLSLLLIRPLGLWSQTAQLGILITFGNTLYFNYLQGDQMFLWKNRPKTMKNCPKSRPTMFLLDLLYKTVLWCFLFDFMLISNGTGHSFIVFFIKKEINFFEYFWKTCKKPLLEQNFSLIKVNFGQFFHGLNFAQITGQFFLEKICPMP